VVNFKNLFTGMVLGAIVALGVTYGQQRWHEHTHPHVAAPTPTRPQVDAPAPQPIEDRMREHTAQEEWLRRRDLEFDKCAVLHGTPTFGFGMRVVCLDSHAVKFLGEEHPE